MPHWKNAYRTGTVMYKKEHSGTQTHKLTVQNTETHVHKITYGSLIDTAMYVMLLMRANPLLGQVGRGLAPEISIFWAPNCTRLKARCHFTGPKKS